MFPFQTPKVAWSLSLPRRFVLIFYVHTVCAMDLEERFCLGRGYGELSVYVYTPSVNMQGFVWKFLWAIYKLSFIDS